MQPAAREMAMAGVQLVSPAKTLTSWIKTETVSVIIQDAEPIQAGAKQEALEIGVDQSIQREMRDQTL